jgi:F-type H+-transporting ATPase subunit b
MNFIELFRINISYIIFYTIDFFIILLILQKYLFKKINTVLEDREKKIKESIENSKFIEQKKDEIEKEYREKMIQTQKESEQIILEARESAENIRLEILESSKEESARIISEAEKETEKFHDQIYIALKKELLDLVVIGVSKSLEDFLDEKEKEKIIKKSMEFIKNER